MRRLASSFVSALALGGLLALTACGGGGGSDSTDPNNFGRGSTTPTTPTTPTDPTAAASVQLSASPATVKSDNSTTTTVTVTTLNASNATVSGVAVNLSVDTGVLNTSSVSTDTTGKATFTFSSGSTSKANRTATITATAGTVSTQLPVQIVGSTLTANATSTTLTDSGTLPATLTITAKDAGGNAISGAAVTLTTSGTGTATVPASGTTNANGVLSVSVAGAAAGSVTVTASAAGATAATTFNVTPTAATFGIDQTTNTTTGAVLTNPSTVAMKIGDSLQVEVNAPAPTTQVTFATTIGSWNGGGSTLTVAVGGACGAGKACASLTTAQAGLANVQVFDPAAPTTNTSTLTVAMTAAVASKVTLQASPTVVAKSVGTTTGVSTLVATVTDALGRPVGGAPVSFAITNPTGGGETVTPVVAFSASTPSSTLSLGQASATFTSGSLPSSQQGVQIRASVLGTGVQTSVSPSGPDATIIIGGTAGSIAFGQATSLAVVDNNTNYQLAMSVLVSDVNGSPAPAGTVVNLSAWPVAWSTGVACSFDLDNGVNAGTFLNEDINENLVLDPGEDGTRTYYAGGTTATGVPTTKDGLLTPPNTAAGIVAATAAGSVPGTVVTDANGVATFNLTYGKRSAIWIITRIRARTIVQGTEAVSEVKFRLAPVVSDVQPTCLLPDSPYQY